MSDDDAPEQRDPAPAEERPRRKKRRRAAEDTPEAAAIETVEDAPAAKDAGADSMVPAFARKFPRDPALDALVAAFEAGDYARVRREAPALASSTDRDEVRAAARELTRRLTPDPVAVYLLALAALLLAFLAGWYWLHPHAH